VIKEKRERERPHLVVDNGNFVRGTNWHDELKAQVLARAMHLMDYDAINLAQEEVIFGPDRILDLRNRERIPLVSTNLLRRDSGRSLVSPYLIKRLGTSRFLGFEYGGVKVGIVGLVGQGVRNPKGQQASGELTLANLEETLSETLGKLKKHCDLVIVLSDLDLRRAKELAQKVGGIDLFFVRKGARAKQVEVVEGTIFMCPANKGKELGDIELFLDDQNQVASYQVDWTLLDKKVEGDEEIRQLVSDYKAALKEQKVPQKGCE
jgi:2',3'-cyclic-nucleotide 2'-phosphodiesterase (5'-nucleotidase family)